ncbi:hypothetical protein IW261DRAFT_1596041 [Armillaria novae-zelandiae]|uniref:Uncharacterized protein n=1 Tax=Armillaria novae-zelandiae TaxID=153914 RepID=A0AA39NYK5_9AGAR|nr:hypothetical protein IW261DRAFT_1596041 [Armillaria novae-zelandiae]
MSLPTGRQAGHLVWFSHLPATSLMQQIGRWISEGERIDAIGKGGRWAKGSLLVDDLYYYCPAAAKTIITRTLPLRLPQTRSTRAPCRPRLECPVELFSGALLKSINQRLLNLEALPHPLIPGSVSPDVPLFRPHTPPTRLLKCSDRFFRPNDAFTVYFSSTRPGKGDLFVPGSEPYPMIRRGGGECFEMRYLGLSSKYANLYGRTLSTSPRTWMHQREGGGALVYRDYLTRRANTRLWLSCMTPATKRLILTIKHVQPLRQCNPTTSANSTSTPPRPTDAESAFLTKILCCLTHAIITPSTPASVVLPFGSGVKFCEYKHRSLTTGTPMLAVYATCAKVVEQLNTRPCHQRLECLSRRSCGVERSSSRQTPQQCVSRKRRWAGGGVRKGGKSGMISLFGNGARALLNKILCCETCAIVSSRSHAHRRLNYAPRAGTPTLEETRNFDYQEKRHQESINELEKESTHTSSTLGIPLTQESKKNPPQT